MTHKTIRRAAITILFFGTMLPAFAKPGAPATAAGQAQTVSQGTSTKSGGAKTASRNATAQSNASTNPQSANQQNNSPNTGSNNPGIAPAGWVPDPEPADESGQQNHYSKPESPETRSHAEFERQEAIEQLAATYNYDAVGNLQNFSYPNGVTSAYSYDALNRLAQVGSSKSATSISNYAYTLGAAGNRLTVGRVAQAFKLPGVCK